MLPRKDRRLRFCLHGWFGARFDAAVPGSFEVPVWAKRTSGSDARDMAFWEGWLGSARWLMADGSGYVMFRSALCSS